MRAFLSMVPAGVSTGFVALLFLMPLACAKKSMNDRDVRREQLRINAHKKRQEMRRLPGEYLGKMTDASGYVQDVSLHLVLKEQPESEQGEVDPVLVPTVTGTLGLTYGSRPQLELYSFGTVTSDFDASSSKLDLVVKNSQFNEVSLSLLSVSDGFVGNWSSPSTSAAGEIEFFRTSELYLGGDLPQISGTYDGVMRWDKSKFISHSTLTLSTAQDGVDSFHVTASLTINSKTPAGKESFFYEFETVEFNPLTRQFSFASATADIYLIGQLGRGEITGNWYSKRGGLLGPFIFSKSQITIGQPATENPGASGTWFAKVKKTSPTTELPEYLMLSFNITPDKTQPGGMRLAGSARFYYGSYSSNEYLEYHFDEVSYLPFFRQVVAATKTSPKLTFNCDLETGLLAGVIMDSSLGAVGSFSASRQAGPVEGLSIEGDYNGFFEYDALEAYQTAKINLVPVFDPTGLKIRAAVQIFFGTTAAGEALAYRFDKSDFNSVSGLLTLSDPNADILIKAYVKDGNLKGEWFSTALGRLGKVDLSKITGTLPRPQIIRIEPVKGTYRGTLRNTSSDTNLPERIMFGLISTSDPKEPRGLRVTGNVRLYYGSFESHEFVELPLESVQFDPYRRTVSGKTAGTLNLTVQGQLSIDNKITGTLSDDSLGQVGLFEVEKYEE